MCCRAGVEEEACGETPVGSYWDLVNDNKRCAFDLQGLAGGLSHMPNGWGKDECVLEMNFIGWVLGMDGHQDETDWH